jgi:hypothetical protein
VNSARCDRKRPGWSGTCGAPMQERIDHLGRILWQCPRCTWQEAGRCWRCSQPRENTSSRASLCAACRVVRRREATARRDKDPARKHQRRAGERRRQRSAKRRAWKAAWRKANPDKIRAYKRKYALNPSPTRKATEARHNACPKRQAIKRAQALARYYALHPERPQPVCRVCQAAIPFVPPGRPKTRCDACVPTSVLAKRRSQSVAVAA